MTTHELLAYANEFPNPIAYRRWVHNEERICGFCVEKNKEVTRLVMFDFLGRPYVQWLCNECEVDK